MITLHIVEHNDHWHVWKELSNKREKMKEKRYEKADCFGKFAYIIAFLCDFYPKFNYWNSAFFSVNDEIVKVNIEY